MRQDRKRCVRSATTEKEDSSQEGCVAKNQRGMRRTGTVLFVQLRQSFQIGLR